MRTMIMLSLLLYSLLILSNSVFGQDQTPNAVRGAISRMEAIHSGRITYKETSGTSDDKETETYKLTFSGNSWKKEFSADISSISSNFSENPGKQDDKFDITKLTGLVDRSTVSHDGRVIVYTSCPQFDEPLHKTARVTTGEDSMEQQYPPFPQFTGTFWYHKTLSYVKEHKSEAKYKRVGKIDGHDVVVYEWTVSAANKFHAFSYVNELTHDGGILRVFIAPSLGYAIPRIEHVGISGKPGVVITSTDFTECNGFHIPKKSQITILQNEVPGFTIAYELSSITDINEPIPESEFILTLPVGTEVADSTSGTHSEFFTVSEDPNSIPDDLLNSIQTPRKNFIERWGWQGAVGVGILLGLMILGGLYMVRRIRSRRAAV